MEFHRNVIIFSEICSQKYWFSVKSSKNYWVSVKMQWFSVKNTDFQWKNSENNWVSVKHTDFQVRPHPTPGPGPPGPHTVESWKSQLFIQGWSSPAQVNWSWLLRVVSRGHSVQGGRMKAYSGSQKKMKGKTKDRALSYWISWNKSIL